MLPRNPLLSSWAHAPRMPRGSGIGIAAVLACAVVLAALFAPRASDASPAPCSANIPYLTHVDVGSAGLGDPVFDATCTFLYMPDLAANAVQVFDLQTQTLLAPIAVGTQPTGADITPDGAFLYVANAGENTVSVVDLASRLELRRIAIVPPASAETPNSVAVMGNGNVLVTTTAPGTNPAAHVFTIDLATDAVTERDDASNLTGSQTGLIVPGSHLYRSQDRSAAAVVPGVVSGGTVTVYRTSADAFDFTLPPFSTPNLLFGFAALSRNGDRLLLDGVHTLVYDGGLHSLGFIGSGGGGCPTTPAVCTFGLAVSPGIGGFAYRAFGSGIDVISLISYFPTGTSLPIGDTIGYTGPTAAARQGAMTVSADGALLAVITANGFSVLRPTIPSPRPKSADTLAVDADANTPGIQSTNTVPVGSTVTVSVLLTAAPEPYSNYQSYLGFDPDALLYGSGTVSPDGFLGAANSCPLVVLPIGLYEGCLRLAGTQTDTGNTVNYTFTCTAAGTSPLHLWTTEDLGAYSLSTNFVPNSSSLPSDATTIDASVTCITPPAATPTSTVTATATAVQPVRMVKDTDDDLDEPSELSNLWLCKGSGCTANGQGYLDVHEWAVGVGGDPQGVGAFEFDVGYDNHIFDIAVEPTNWLYSTGRVPGDAGVGGCAATVITENDIRFGCVSKNPQPLDPGNGSCLGTDNQTPVAGAVCGPKDDDIIAVIHVTPKADLIKRITPGNDNGAIRTLLDSGCEFADIWGHPLSAALGAPTPGVAANGYDALGREVPLPGIAPGGQVPDCADLTVTVRILEGDMDTDCTVDVADDQLEAAHYQAIFGTTLYDPWYDLEPALKDGDVDIKDLQKVFGRNGSTCAAPVPPQPPLPQPGDP